MAEEHKKLDYSQIDAHIFIGTNMCCKTHFEEELLSQGIVADISLEEENIDAPFGVDFFHWLPVTDHTPPAPDQILVGVSIMQAHIDLDHKIYVHCKNGHGRAPTMVAAYYISQGATVEEAIETIREKRPSIHLDDVQIDRLKEFAALLTEE
jgi:protein-tyrosine phosphatase